MACGIACPTYTTCSSMSAAQAHFLRSEGRDKGHESRNGNNSQPLTLSPKQTSRCFEPQDSGKLLSGNNLLCVQHIVVYILVDVYPCNRDSYEIKYPVESHHVPTSLITTSAMLKGSGKWKVNVVCIQLEKSSQQRRALQRLISYFIVAEKGEKTESQ